MSEELFTELKQSESDAIKGGFGFQNYAGYLPVPGHSPQASSGVNVNESFNQNNDTLNNVAANNGNFVTGNFNPFVFLT